MELETFAAFLIVVSVLFIAGHVQERIVPLLLGDDK
jgi:hypothetical protein